MNKITAKFNQIWSKAEAVNLMDDPKWAEASPRIRRIYEPYKNRYVRMGLYDTVTKKYVIFDTINLMANFRYNQHKIPQELRDMETLVYLARKEYAG